MIGYDGYCLQVKKQNNSIIFKMNIMQLLHRDWMNDFQSIFSSLLDFNNTQNVIDF